MHSQVTSQTMQPVKKIRVLFETSVEMTISRTNIKESYFAWAVGLLQGGMEKTVDPLSLLSNHTDVC